MRLAVAAALRPFAIDDAGAGGVLLAVSGGRDSMALLDAAARGARSVVRAVATFDHGTGPHAVDAAALVRAVAGRLGVPVIDGIATHAGCNEASWREARWHFLRRAAATVGAATVATAHTRDDQTETVVMRALRGAGARGLAALAAHAEAIVRPLLSFSRADVARYAAVEGVPWVEDPSNADRRHLRVRLRGDLLPAIGRVCPDASARLVALAARAAAWREDGAAWAARVGVDDLDACSPGVCASGIGEVSRHARVAVSVLAGCDAATLAVFWPAFAARAGVRLDGRALTRLVTYTAHVVRRVRDGTVQPARVPVAGTTHAGTGAGTTVALVYAVDPTADGRRAWQFVVCGRGPQTSADVAGGVAALGSSDYA